MRITESFCKEQAALQREKALNEPLENRKVIALNAAKVWDKEAEMAHNRDTKQAQRDAKNALFTAQLAAEDKFEKAD